MFRNAETSEPDHHRKEVTDEKEVSRNMNDGLEVASDPELANTSKEVWSGESNIGPSVAGLEVYTTATGHTPEHAEKKVHPTDAQPTSITTDAANAHSKGVWWKRKRVWLTAGVLLLIVAIVLGIVGGLVWSQNSQPSPADSGTTSTGATSKCREAICRQIFATATIDSTLFLVARGDDQAIWTQSHNGTAWADRWESLSGQFQSQPATVVWADSSRLDVSGLTSSGILEYTSFTTGRGWDAGWTDFKMDSDDDLVVGSAISTCHAHALWGLDRADYWLRATDSSVMHEYLELESSGDLQPSEWSSKPGDGLAPGASPGLACRNSDSYHDLVVYNSGTYSVSHSQYKNSTGNWTERHDLGGSFIGDPVVISPSDDRIDFFGTGVDGALYHFSWEAGEYSALENMGGQLESVPAALVTADGRIDIVGVGLDDKLKHRALVDDVAYPDEWEDLGVFANSAPQLMLLPSAGQASSQVGIVVLDENNEASWATWEVSQETSWKGAVSGFESIGGALTASWYEM